MARRASLSKTATPSSCAAGPSVKACRASVSAMWRVRCCRHVQCDDSRIKIPRRRRHDDSSLQLLSQFGIVSGTHRVEFERPVLRYRAGAPAQQWRRTVCTGIQRPESTIAGAGDGRGWASHHAVAGDAGVPGRTLPDTGAAAGGLAGSRTCARDFLAIACDIHPLNNLRVLRMLKQELGVSDEVKQKWIQHWVKLGFAALEQQLAASPQRGRFCFGDTPTMADCCLVPQIFNARRFEVDMTPYPTLAAIDEACGQLKAFQLAQPSAQPDAA